MNPVQKATYFFKKKSKVGTNEECTVTVSSQASVRSSIIANTVSALTSQKAFLNNFEDIVNRRVNIEEDIKHYQDTLSYAPSKVDYSVGENIYMLPSDKNLNIKTGTVGYNNKILISDSKFNLGKNDKVNSLELAKHTFTPMKSNKDSKVIAHSTTTHGLAQNKLSLTKRKELL